MIKQIAITIFILFIVVTLILAANGTGWGSINLPNTIFQWIAVIGIVLVVRAFIK